jgi:sterol desaturase/sphingolipid hydroxylase (fatty acid hydroxylase superfamily)
MFVFFNILYWASALGGKWLLQWLHKKQLVSPVDNQALYPGQIKTEVRNSLVSITIFSLQGILIQQGIKYGWLHISFYTNWYCIPQMIILFLWNEVHFYFVHRLLHMPWLTRRVHWVHHHSKEPTVFSTFSFHWIEAFLLGTVIIFPLAIYPFQLPALLFLPVMSIVLNTLGHCNYDLFPKLAVNSVFKFSNRHSMHHEKGRGNYGFMLPWFDNLFRTGISKK